MHRFNPDKMQKLDSEERRAFLNADSIWRLAGLKEGMAAADIGCGIGFFSFAGASIAGSNGMIYALDMQSPMIEELQKRIAAQQTQNIQPILTDEYDLKLPAQSADIALIAFVLHEVEDKPLFLAETARILKPKGRVCLLEWKKTKTQGGPDINERIDEQEAAEVLKAAGFENIHTHDYNEQTYLIFASKSH